MCLTLILRKTLLRKERILRSLSVKIDPNAILDLKVFTLSLFLGPGFLCKNICLSKIY